MAENGPAACDGALAGPSPGDEASWTVSCLLNDLALGLGAAAGAGGLPPRLLRALVHVLGCGAQAITVGDLAEGLRVSIGRASRIADELALAGLIERERDRADRRLVRLRLAGGARIAGRRLLRRHEIRVAAAFGDAAPHERTAILRFLDRLAAELGRTPEEGEGEA